MLEGQQLNKTVIRDVISFCEANTIKDLVDIIKTGKDFGKDLFYTSKLQTGSIAKRASQLVLVFPVLVSTSLSIETAILISKAIEKKCVSLLQILFSAINLTDYKDTKDLYDYMSKFHTNLDQSGVNISLDDFITAADIVATHAGGLVISDKDAYDMVMNEFKRMNTIAKDIIKEYSVNNFKVTKTMYGKTNITLEANIHPKNLSTTQSLANNDPDMLKSQIVNTDVNKANELVPTTMIINYTTMVDGTAVQRSGVVGVKAKLYPIESMELIGRISSKYQDSNLLMKFIKATTGEKSFFKDLAFAFDKLKLDAVNIAKGSVNSRIFGALERRANANNRKFLRMGDASPITTMVISQEEVEYLKKYSHMDLEKISIAIGIMNGYNLMGLVIADDTTEVARFLFDDKSNAFEAITYSALAKEDSSGMYKKIVNLMTKINK